MHLRSTLVLAWTLFCAQAVKANASEPLDQITPIANSNVSGATSPDCVLEFVTDAIIASGPEPSPLGFNPPILDLAAITPTQVSSTPERSTWALTILGIGGACLAAKLRRRPSSSSAAYERVKQG